MRRFSSAPVEQHRYSWAAVDLMMCAVLVLLAALALLAVEHKSGLLKLDSPVAATIGVGVGMHIGVYSKQTFGRASQQNLYMPDTAMAANCRRQYQAYLHLFFLSAHQPAQVQDEKAHRPEQGRRVMTLNRKLMSMLGNPLSSPTNVANAGNNCPSRWGY